MRDEKTTEAGQGETTSQEVHPRGASARGTLRHALNNPYTGVLAIFLSRLLAGESPVVYEDGQQTRDFISVHDVAAAFMAAIERPAATGVVMNIGSGTPRFIGEVARTLATLVGVPSIEPTITGQFRRGDVRHCTADLSRAHQLLGFTPQVSWQDGLAELTEWCREASTADHFAQADQELRQRGLVSDQLKTERTQ